MLKSLNLKCFRQHEDLKIDFGAGLNVIRGPNESGKTTLLEAAGYALYGTAFLRNSLSEVVTWDHKESELKVELVISIKKQDYRFVRSKAGAEVWFSGAAKPDVTGQKEVSAFAAELLGAEVKSATVLMMASQNGLRGALDEGPAAVSALMAKLADFDMIDRIIEAAQGQLLLGADGPIKTKLVAAEAEVNDLLANMPTAQKWEGIELLRANAESQITEIDTHQRTVLQVALQAAEEAYLAGRKREDDRAALVRQQDDTTAQRERTLQLIGQAEAVLAQRPAAEAIQAAKAKIVDDADVTALINLHALVTGLPPYPEVHWDQPRATFDEEMARLAQAAADADAKVKGIQAEISGLRRSLITEGKCPTCGHAEMTAEHVHETNAPVIQRIQQLEKDLVAAQAVVADVAGDRAAMNGVVMAAKVFDVVVPRVAGSPRVNIDDSVYPPRISWVGEIPVKVDNTAARRELSALEASERAATLAEGQLQIHRATVAELDEKLVAIAAQLAGLPAIDLAPLAEAYNQAAADNSAGLQRLEALRSQIAEYTRQRDAAKAELDLATAKLEAARARVVEYTADLKKLSFNNTLVAKLKKLKPMITDHLWSSVLAAVGNFFSGMRGEQSVVTKDKDGFKVNARSVESLSGSTLDALALAIRVALTKTFIPHASFLTLDEPAHGCDNNRTGNVLGFLSGVGFEQTLLASHDELSEAVADRIIQLGA